MIRRGGSALRNEGICVDERQFALVARIQTTDRDGIQVVLAKLLPHGIITPTGEQGVRQ